MVGEKEGRFQPGYTNRIVAKGNVAVRNFGCLQQHQFHARCVNVFRNENEMSTNEPQNASESLNSERVLCFQAFFHFMDHHQCRLSRTNGFCR